MCVRVCMYMCGYGCGCMGMNAKCCATTVSSQILEKPAPMSKCSGSCSTAFLGAEKRGSLIRTVIRCDVTECLAM